ncbi:MAG: hypothetical protein ACK5A0_01130 [Polaromonas sp.]|jgi:hypothetical protein
MFSDRLRRIDHASGRALLLIAGGLVIVCQLVAMMLVSQGQVEKAQAREISRANQRAATAWCIETSRGAELKACARQQSAGYPAKAADSTSTTSASRY